MLVVISGLPGTGKSAVATEVAREVGGVHLSIDTVEDALLGAGFPHSWTTGVAAYEAVRSAAEQNLDLGRIVVVDAVNDSDFGLQVGVFTGNLGHAMRAWDRLEVGGVIVGDVPSFRVDNMPYGGVKHSGLGREGVRYAIEDMSEQRLLVIRT